MSLSAHIVTHASEGEKLGDARLLQINLVVNRDLETKRVESLVGAQILN